MANGGQDFKRGDFLERCYSLNSLLLRFSLRKKELATVLGRAPEPCVWVLVLSSFCPPGACNCPAVVLWPRCPTLCRLLVLFLFSWCPPVVLLVSSCPPGVFLLPSWCPLLVLLMLLVVPHTIYCWGSLPKNGHGLWPRPSTLVSGCCPPVAPLLVQPCAPSLSFWCPAVLWPCWQTLCPHLVPTNSQNMLHCHCPVQALFVLLAALSCLGPCSGLLVLRVHHGLVWALSTAWPRRVFFIHRLVRVFFRVAMNATVMQCFKFDIIQTAGGYRYIIAGVLTNIRSQGVDA